MIYSSAISSAWELLNPTNPECYTNMFQAPNSLPHNPGIPACPCLDSYSTFYTASSSSPPPGLPAKEGRAALPSTTGPKCQKKLGAERKIILLANKPLGNRWWLFPIVLNLWKILTAKLNALLQQALFFSQGNITWLATVNSISQPVVTSEILRCPVKHSSFTKEAEFSKLMRQFCFLARNAKPEAAQCILSPTMEGNVTTQGNLVVFPSLAGQPGALVTRAPPWMSRHCLEQHRQHIIEGYYIIDCKLGCLLFPNMCLN